jgi:hypothetical protein
MRDQFIHTSDVRGMPGALRRAAVSRQRSLAVAG